MAPTCRLVLARQSSDDRLAGDDARHGRSRPFVFAWIAAAPEVTRRLQDGS